MYGSIHRGYDGKPKPEPEWNVKANPAAARALLAAPWREAILTPLDTCGRVQLSGERYARVRGSSDPLLRGLVEAYGIWCRNRDWCAKDPALRRGEELDALRLRGRLPRDLARPREDGDDGRARHGRGDDRPGSRGARLSSGRPSGRDLDGFEEWLTARLTAPRRRAEARLGSALAWAPSRPPREAEAEGRAVADPGRLQPDPPAVRLHDAPGQGQPEAGPLDARVEPVEELEHPGLVRGVDADAVVADVERHLPGPGPLVTRADPDLGVASGRP